MRLQIVCRLSRSWVTMNTVSPSVSLSVEIRVSNSAAPIGSRPEVGSSRKRMSGSSASARARPARLVMPPDSSDGNFSAASCGRPTSSIFSRASSSISRGERSRYSRIGTCTFCRRFSEENSAPCWKRTPSRRSIASRSTGLASSRSMPKIRIEPACLRTRPRMVRSNTLLPVPDAPTTPRISPA
jgi:hypothetical protein